MDDENNKRSQDSTVNHFCKEVLDAMNNGSETNTLEFVSRYASASYELNRSPDILRFLKRIGADSRKKVLEYLSSRKDISWKDIERYSEDPIKYLIRKKSFLDHIGNNHDLLSPSIVILDKNGKTKECTIKFTDSGNSILVKPTDGQDYHINLLTSEIEPVGKIKTKNKITQTATDTGSQTDKPEDEEPIKQSKIKDQVTQTATDTGSQTDKPEDEEPIKQSKIKDQVTQTATDTGSQTDKPEDEEPIKQSKTKDQVTQDATDTGSQTDKPEDEEPIKQSKTKDQVTQDAGATKRTSQNKDVRSKNIGKSKQSSSTKTKKHTDETVYHQYSARTPGRTPKEQDQIYHQYSARTPGRTPKEQDQIYHQYSARTPGRIPYEMQHHNYNEDDFDYEEGITPLQSHQRHVVGATEHMPLQAQNLPEHHMAVIFDPNDKVGLAYCDRLHGACKDHFKNIGSRFLYIGSFYGFISKIFPTNPSVGDPKGSALEKLYQFIGHSKALEERLMDMQFGYGDNNNNVTIAEQSLCHVFIANALSAEGKKKENIEIVKDAKKFLMLSDFFAKNEKFLSEEEKKNIIKELSVLSSRISTFISAKRIEAEQIVNHRSFVKMAFAIVIGALSMIVSVIVTIVAITKHFDRQNQLNNADVNKNDFDKAHNDLDKAHDIMHKKEDIPENMIPETDKTPNHSNASMFYKNNDGKFVPIQDLSTQDLDKAWHEMNANDGQNFRDQYGNTGQTALDGLKDNGGLYGGDYTRLSAGHHNYIQSSQNFYVRDPLTGNIVQIDDLEYKYRVEVLRKIDAGNYGGLYGSDGKTPLTANDFSNDGGYKNSLDTARAQNDAMTRELNAYLDSINHNSKTSGLVFDKTEFDNTFSKNIIEADTSLEKASKVLDRAPNGSMKDLSTFINDNNNSIPIDPSHLPNSFQGENEFSRNSTLITASTAIGGGIIGGVVGAAVASMTDDSKDKILENKRKKQAQLSGESNNKVFGKKAAPFDSHSLTPEQLKYFSESPNPLVELRRNPSFQNTKKTQEGLSEYMYYPEMIVVDPLIHRQLLQENTYRRPYGIPLDPAIGNQSSRTRQLITNRLNDRRYLTKRTPTSYRLAETGRSSHTSIPLQVR